MIKKARNNAEASASIRGSLYQVERVLYWLATSKTDSALVGIETGDDVEVTFDTSGRQHRILEQDKFTTTKKFPFTDMSENLWKTLRIWLRQIEMVRRDNRESRFFLVTNKSLNNRTCWVQQFKQGARKAENPMQGLFDIAARGKLKSKLKGIVSEVLAFPEDDIKFLLDRMELVDGASYDHPMNDFQKEIKHGLAISKEIPWLGFYHALFGWLVSEIKVRWDRQEPALFSREEVLSRSNRQIKEFSEKPFLEKAKDTLSFSREDLNRNMPSNFVRQLQLVKCEEAEILEAIHDFLCAKHDRVTKALECGSIGEKDFQEFEDRLFERWQSISRRKIRVRSTDDESILGYDICSETLNHREPLAGYETIEYYTTKGNYHKLANDKRLGWHPNWNTLLSELNRND